ncbi:MAG: biopolymer transporter ExbD [Kiritimatiellae bacterium]|nr:biopolymer transporter ExbD [Kiritimatiellia bacterium]MCB1102568.1 biopolymer transporter ExbD [Kiritimatiellia bacterium]
MAARKRQSRRTREEPGELQMTPMIDVVFQLLVYFLVTIKPMDVIAHLDVFRPQPDQQEKQLQPPPRMMRVAIFADGITINERPVGLPELDGILAKLGSIESNQTIMIMCAADSRHEDLIKVLDFCARSNLRNLSVISMN